MAAMKQSLSSIKTGGINLLPEALRVPGRVQIIARFLRQGSFVALGVYFFILIALLIVSFLFSREEGVIQARNSALAQEIENLKNREGLLAVLKNRARVASIVFTKAPQVRDNLVDDVINTFSPETQVSEIASEVGKTSITALTPNSQAAKEILAKVATIDAEEITLTTLTLDPRGGYSFTLEVK